MNHNSKFEFKPNNPSYTTENISDGIKPDGIQSWHRFLGKYLIFFLSKLLYVNRLNNLTKLFIQWICTTFLLCANMILKFGNWTVLIESHSIRETKRSTSRQMKKFVMKAENSQDNHCLKKKKWNRPATRPDTKGGN